MWSFWVRRSVTVTFCLHPKRHKRGKRPSPPKPDTNRVFVRLPDDMDPADTEGVCVVNVIFYDWSTTQSVSSWCVFCATVYVLEGFCSSAPGTDEQHGPDLVVGGSVHGTSLAMKLFQCRYSRSSRFPEKSGTQYSHFVGKLWMGTHYKTWLGLTVKLG